MELEARREFYEKLYFHALSERSNIESRLKLPLTVLGFVFAILGYLFSEIVIGNKSVHWSCWLLFVLAFLGFFVSAFFLVKAWHGHTYRMLPVPDVLEDHLNDIRLRCEAAEAESEAGQASDWKNEIFNEYLLDTFKGYASHNISKNDGRADSLYYCVTAAIIAFVLGSLSYIPYYYPVSNQIVTEECVDAAKTGTTTTATAKRC